jgi:hypothetical protein
VKHGRRQESGPGERDAGRQQLRLDKAGKRDGSSAEHRQAKPPLSARRAGEQQAKTAGGKDEQTELHANQPEELIDQRLLAGKGGGDGEEDLILRLIA